MVIHRRRPTGLPNYARSRIASLVTLVVVVALCIAALATNKKFSSFPIWELLSAIYAGFINGFELRNVFNGDTVMVRSRRFLISLIICDCCVIFSLAGLSITLLPYAENAMSVRSALVAFMILACIFQSFSLSYVIREEMLRKREAKKSNHVIINGNIQPRREADSPRV